MKKFLFLVTLVTGMVTFAQENDSITPVRKLKPSLVFEYSTRSFQNNSWVVDFYQPLSVNGKYSFSSWNTWTTAIDNPNSSEYITSVNYLNKHISKRLTVSAGVQYLENRTFTFKITTVNFKVRYKVL